MRLVNSKEGDAHHLEVEEFNKGNVPKYAILSHVWEDDEISFQEMKEPNNVTATKKGYEKIRQFCNIASANGLEHTWVDTCCIDKTSSAELSESINSMYRWYQDAEVCYAYLTDVLSAGRDLGGVRISDSRWFRRGFTLQELIAPEKVVFFDRKWNKLGTKEDLQDEISERTNIPAFILSGRADLDDVCVAQRMSWAAGRQTTRPEDRAYSLLGIFGINMPLLYGEGQMAFIRLQEEIIKILDDYSIFAWKSDQSSYGGLLAISPDAFHNSGDIELVNNSIISGNSPWTITNKGIHLDLPYLGVGPRGLGLAILPCGRFGMEGLFTAIYLRDISLTMEEFERVGYDILELLDPKHLQATQYPMRRVCIQQRRVALTSQRRHHATTARCRDRYAEDETKEVTLISITLRTLGVTSSQGVKKDSQTPPAFAPEKGNVERNPLAQKSILLHAAATGDIIRTRACLAKISVKVNVKDLAGETPLSHAARRGHTDVVWLLISRADTMLHLRDDSGMTPLLHAAKEGHATVVKMLLARLESSEPLVDGSGRTALSHASEWGHHAVVALILASNRTHPNEESDISQVPLFQAVKNGHEAAARHLLTHGADIELKQPFRGKAVLHWAAMNADFPMVKLLLAHGAHTEAGDDTSKTALHLVAMNGAASIARLLIDYDAHINAADSFAKTPLHFAVMNRHTSVVKLLVARGAMVELRDRSGKKPLDNARGKSDQHVFGQLLAGGSGDNVPQNADLSHRNVFSRALFGRRNRK